jgi:hypothetical protein
MEQLSALYTSKEEEQLMMIEELRRQLQELHRQRLCEK